MTVLIALLVALVSVTAAAGSNLRPATGAEAEAQIFDRTISCSTAFIGGARSVTAKAHRGTGRSGKAWDRPAFAELTSGQTGSVYTLLDNAFAWITAGKPENDSIVIESPNVAATYPLRVWGTLAWNTRLCRVTSKRVPLGASSLVGATAGPFDEGVNCDIPASVLVRIRATLSKPAAVGSYRQFARVTAPLSTAEISVWTPSGRPLAWMQTLASGTTRLFAARSCEPS